MKTLIAIKKGKQSGENKQYRRLLAEECDKYGILYRNCLGLIQKCLTEITKESQQDDDPDDYVLRCLILASQKMRNILEEI
jgi:hypothetical protein